MSGPSMAGNAKLKRELLRGPLAKIERAKEHVHELNGQVAEYLAGNPFQLRVRERSNPHDRLVYIEAKKPVPEHFALILGDAVHNLRSAIDHISYGIVHDKAPQPGRVGFPFVDKAQRLAGAINTRQMNVAPKHVIDEIHALKPYPGGNDLLHAVKSIDERDKHHCIILVGLGIELTIYQFRELTGADIQGSSDARIAAIGDFIMSLDPGAPFQDFDREANFQPTFTVGFAEGEALVSWPVIPALKEMVVSTEDAVRRLAAAFFK